MVLMQTSVLRKAAKSEQKSTEVYVINVQIDVLHYRYLTAKIRDWTGGGAPIIYVTVKRCTEKQSESRIFL